MRTNNRTEIFSIFGQLEAVAAEIMIKRGEITRIPANEIPPTAAVNEAGQAARFAVIVPRAKIAAFNSLIADLRS